MTISSIMNRFLLLILFISGLTSSAQTTINAYAKITSVTNSSVLALSNVNISNHTFTVGGQVVVMQMQDNVIGTNTTNAASFGNLSSIANAGKYEIRTIVAVNPTSGTPTSMTITPALVNTFNTGANSSVQLISFRDLGSNYTTTANISGVAWNGNIGGVVAFYVTNTLTLNHRILADGIGFRGGAFSGSEDATCVNTTYITNSNLKGFKGEGIYKSTDANFTNGRGKLLTGGGGGSQNNAGGGGGGNYTSGGDGGLGWTCTTANSGYGIGGLSLAAQISADRIFMGGGGGGGQQNNNVGTAGGDGGGIILIKATRLATSGTCGSSIMISANGQTAANSGNDGAGGGGAAGSIIMQVSNYSINPTCPLTVSSNGGNGGTVGNSGSHGGGAGGAQGVIIYSTAPPATNVTTQTNNGLGGANDNSGSPTYAASGSGTNGSGVIGSSVGPLPIELLSFEAKFIGNRVALLWITASESNNDYFIVERSSNGTDYVAISKTPGSGTSHLKNDYTIYDDEPQSGVNYYRLKQYDFDGTFNYSPVISFDFIERIDFTVSPNPIALGEELIFHLNKNALLHKITIIIITVTGEQIYEETHLLDTGSKTSIILKNTHLQEGIYFIKIQNGTFSKTKKLIVK
jgi:hypothetical protein